LYTFRVAEYYRKGAIKSSNVRIFRFVHDPQPERFTLRLTIEQRYLGTGQKPALFSTGNIRLVGGRKKRLAMLLK
jgi:hypothetical protein